MLILPVEVEVTSGELSTDCGTLFSDYLLNYFLIYSTDTAIQSTAMMLPS